MNLLFSKDKVGSVRGSLCKEGKGFRFCLDWGKEGEGSPVWGMQRAAGARKKGRRCEEGEVSPVCEGWRRWMRRRGGGRVVMRWERWDGFATARRGWRWDEVRATARWFGNGWVRERVWSETKQNGAKSNFLCKTYCDNLYFVTIGSL